MHIVDTHLPVIAGDHTRYPRAPVEVAVLMDGALRTCYAAEEPFGILLSAQLSGWKNEG